MSPHLRITVLVLSDRCHRGDATDESGPALAAWLRERGHDGVSVTILPDERDQIAATLTRWCDDGAYDVVLTCGGTGVSPRDVTPDATREVVTRELPGFGEAMRAAGSRHSPHAIISRAIAGLRNGALVINLPGSPRAAVENLAVVWPAVSHTVSKAQGDDTPCATP